MSTHANKRKRPHGRARTGWANKKPSGYRKIVRKWLKQAGLWWNKGQPGHGKKYGHKRGWKNR